MKVCTATLKGVSDMSQSRQHEVPALEKESKDAYEIRTWREKLHYDKQTGQINIPQMALKQALTDSSRMLGFQIPGRGKSTYTKHFEAGVLCVENFPIDRFKDEINPARIWCNANGVRGPGKRVVRYFPIIPAGWKCSATFHVYDETITGPVFERVLVEAGKFVGIGRFRPIVGGFLGRFTVEAFAFEDLY
jgi:hypothetical protein